MRKIVSAVVLVMILIGVSFVAGYWPEHGRLKSSERDNHDLRQQLYRSEQHVRICGLENQLLAVIEQIGSKNYGKAQELSNRLFDNVRAELMQADDPTAKGLLQDVLNTRDSITAGLARGEPDTLQNLLSSLSRFRQFFEVSAGKRSEGGLQ